tara:strand:+ start:346 stop:462 length:117 start_codon:yes stop_codon:yes gene_type:complete
VEHLWVAVPPMAIEEAPKLMQEGQDLHKARDLELVMEA